MGKHIESVAVDTGFTVSVQGVGFSRSFPPAMLLELISPEWRERIVAACKEAAERAIEAMRDCQSKNQLLHDLSWVIERENVAGIPREQRTSTAILKELEALVRQQTDTPVECAACDSSDANVGDAFFSRVITSLGGGE